MKRQHPFPSAKSASALAVLIALAGCTVGPDYKRPDIALPANYSDAPQSSSAAAPISRDWWKLYNDATLNELVEASMHNNKDLQSAVAQIDQAAAVLDQTNSALLPEIDLEANSARTRASRLNAMPIYPGVPVITNSNRLALSTTFELDFWGQLRRASEGARAKFLSSRFAHDVVALSLTGSVTQSYFTLRSLDAQIAVTGETLTANDETLSVTINRAKGGLDSSLDVSQAKVSRSDAALQLRELQRQRTLMEHQLALLCGKPGLKIVAAPATTLPNAVEPPIGLPSTLIKNRPDVQQAEQALIAANANIGFNKAAQLPSFSLTGYYGGQSKTLADIIKSGANIWSLGLNATLPIIDAGKYSAVTRQAEAAQRQALAGYQKSVENAFKEVADALTNIADTNASIADQQNKTDAARKALHLSRLRYEAGYSGYLEVLIAQRTALSAEQALLQNRQAQLLYNIDLMKALGGGWSPENSSPVAKR